MNEFYGFENYLLFVLYFINEGFPSFNWSFILADSVSTTLFPLKSFAYKDYALNFKFGKGYCFDG